MRETLEILTPDRALVDDLTRLLRCDPVLSTLLVNRGITDPQTALDFMYPALNKIRPPDDLCDIDPAAERIAVALEAKQKILVFGDYDVDGVTATCLLTEFLQEVGADASYHIPDRITEGYSLSTAHISNGTVPAGTRLIITVDCGTSSTAAVKSAATAGIDVIITDHHKVTTALPAAIAVVNPNREECHSGLGFLAGVGVVFYLVIALRKMLRERNFFKQTPEPNLKKYCDLVALGTVADRVPLVRENRILTSIGLEIINAGARPGLNHLIKASRINTGRVDSEDIAYKLAPRLNAAGRIRHAAISVDLMGASEDDNPGEMAASLDNLNRERQKIEKATFSEISDRLARSPELLTRPAIVLSSPTWHPGITGIVSSRLARLFNRPVFLVCMQAGVGKGSGRSIPGIDIVSCLKECSPVLERYGGHPAAAGITVTDENFNVFRELFESAVEERFGRGISPPGIRIDCELDFSQIQAGLLDTLELLQPFGQGNPEPLFLAQEIRVLSSKGVGQGHSRLLLSQCTKDLKKSLAAIYFNSGAIPPNASRVVFALCWNRWNGKKKPQAVVKYLD